MRKLIQASISRFTSQHIPLSSLQFRLTLELVILSVLGLGGVATWAGWQMEQNLIAVHKQTLEYIAMRFPEQLALYNEMGSDRDADELGLEWVIQRVSTPGLAVWVQAPNGQLLAQSPHLQSDAAEIRDVATLPEVPTTPQVVRFGDRDIILCGSPLELQGETLGKLYLSQDITLDQQRLNRSLKQLIWGSIVVVIVLTIAISKRISGAMQPLAEMSRVASAISVNDLSAAKLELQQAPDEILGLVETFNEMLFRLSGAWEQQRQFMGNVSHELRTPLTVVSGYLHSLLRRSTNLSPYQQQALETATAETERTIRMLQDLLDLARADSGHLHFRLNPIILNTLVAEVVAMSEKVSNRQINMILTDEDLVACSDQERLQQVLINLVDNAIKYSAPDQAVDLIVEKANQEALIHVRDRGIGIPLAHQQRIFERFYRVDEAMTRSRDGTGLGLAIAKSLIEGMKGRITLRSKPGEGSLFTITLPLWQANHYAPMTPYHD